ATIPQIKHLLSGLGVAEDDFLRATGGTFKLGIRFKDWAKLGDSYIHTFDQPGPGLGLLPFHQYWLRGRQEGWAEDLDAYSLNALAAGAGRFARGATAPGQPPLAYAYHIDATLFAAYLRRYAEARGVKRVEGRVVDTPQTEAGEIRHLVVADGRRVEGQLFIDCSGFRGLLMEALGVGYEDWSAWLPCDRALAVPSAPAEATPPYTQASAARAGWRWRIPLQHRTGNGYVYCSRFIDDDAAREELLAGLEEPPLAEPRPLRFRTGKRHEFWRANCIAIGLASGFLEPLESTSIHMVQTAVARLLQYLPDRVIEPADRAAYNRLTHYEYDRIRDFLVLHYKATARDDTPFWRLCRDLPLPDSLAQKLDLFTAGGRVQRDQDELFTEASWLQVMLGQGVTPRGRHPLTDNLSAPELRGFLDTVRGRARQVVTALPTHAEHIARTCAMPRPPETAV
ncbi:MAG: tryptophan halogenase family protein, partial [Caulobacteraceae bacterium]